MSKVMHPIKIFQTALAASILIASSNALSQRAPSGEECFNHGSNAEARNCLAAKAKMSELALVRVERAAILSLGQSDAAQQARQRAISALKSAAIAFHQYRSRQCAFQVAMAAGGTGATHRQLLCEIALNDERASYMRPIQAVGQ